MRQWRNDNIDMERSNSEIKDISKIDRYSICLCRIYESGRKLSAID